MTSSGAQMLSSKFLKSCHGIEPRRCEAVRNDSVFVLSINENACVRGAGNSDFGPLVIELLYFGQFGRYYALIGLLFNSTAR
jgi:hypothetical protein